MGAMQNSVSELRDRTERMVMSMLEKSSENAEYMVPGNGATDRLDDAWGFAIGEDPRKLRKRPLNEELFNVWDVMLDEKIEKIRKRQSDIVFQDPNEYRRLEAYINGITEAWALLVSLEKGRFKKDYNRIVEEMRKENEK